MKQLANTLAFLICSINAFQFPSLYSPVDLENMSLSGHKISVLILPPFDEIANAGVSPDIQKILEEQLAKDGGLSIIKFPYKKLMNVLYQNIFDKKYCKPILKKIQPSVIIMTKLDYMTVENAMETDKWNLQIRLFYVQENIQIDSKIKIDSSNVIEIKSKLSANNAELIKEIKNIK